MKQILLVLVVFIFQSMSFAGEKLPLCSALTDQFCEELWSTQHNGNLVGKNFKFNLGETGKSEIYQRTIMFMQNFLDHEKEYPEDFQKNISEFVGNVRKILSEESYGPIWYEKFENLLDQIPILIRATSDQRLVAKYPKYNQIKWDDINQAGKSLYQEYYFDLYDKILEIQYANDPRWLRVKNVFTEVRADFLQMIDLKFPPSVREYAKKKISAIQFSLPYRNPKTVGSESRCVSVGTNAYYMPGNNKFTMCIGRINAIQDDAGTYITIAHEMAHAIDPYQLAADDYISKELFQPMIKICKSPGPTMKCEDWNKYQKQFADSLDFTMGISPYDKLTSCLSPRNELDKFDKKTIASIAKKQTRKSLSNLAVDNWFTLLSQKTVRKNGKIKVNEYYLRPDLLKINDNNNLPSEKRCLASVIPELFTQIYSCEEKDSGDNRSVPFEKSLKELKSFVEVMKQKWSWSCGRECDELAGDNLSTDATERFADWVSYRLFAKRVSREATLEDQRNFVARAEAILCKKPGPLKDAPDLTRIEQNYSLEPHPDDRVRRLAVFQPEVVDIVKCIPTEEVVKGSHSCDF